MTGLVISFSQDKHVLGLHFDDDRALAVSGLVGRVWSGPRLAAAVECVFDVDISAESGVLAFRWNSQVVVRIGHSFLASCRLVTAYPDCFELLGATHL
jgi:hypothetical protein